MSILLINYPDLEYVYANPWSTVKDLSEFLNYCCPECDYTDKFEQSFSYHALQNHKNSSVFFASNKNKLPIDKHSGSNKVGSNPGFFNEYEYNQYDFAPETDNNDFNSADWKKVKIKTENETEIYDHCVIKSESSNDIKTNEHV